MKNHKKLYIFFTTVIILSLLVVGSASAKSPNKQDICHNNGNGSYTLVKIKTNDLQAHLAHGDAAPGEAVPGQAGKVFSAKCAVVSTSPDTQAQTPSKKSVNNHGKKADKVDVCHRTGNGRFILINISRNALPAHIAHGDGQPGEVLPGTHTKFGTDCSLVVIPEREVVERFSISSAISVPVTSTNVLAAGQLYEIVVTGTYTYVAGAWADAEWALWGGNVVKELPSPPYKLNVLDLTINGCAANNNTEWGGLQLVTHVYKLLYQGTGEKISFVICDTYYKDNKGSLEVTIYKKNW
jgi:hypothetical protein